MVVVFSSDRSSDLTSELYFINIGLIAVDRATWGGVRMMVTGLTAGDAPAFSRFSHDSAGFSIGQSTVPWPH